MRLQHGKPRGLQIGGFEIYCGDEITATRLGRRLSEKSLGSSGRYIAQAYYTSESERRRIFSCLGWQNFRVSEHFVYWFKREGYEADLLKSYAENSRLGLTLPAEVEGEEWFGLQIRRDSASRLQEAKDEPHKTRKAEKSKLIEEFMNEFEQDRLLEGYVVLYEEDDTAVIGTVSGGITTIPVDELKNNSAIAELASSNLEAIDASQKGILEVDERTFERINSHNDQSSHFVRSVLDEKGRDHWIVASYDPEQGLWVVWTRVVF